jgi:DMSO/TMAO reductase YedYZ molybdopterin-dependent catalytic subunit
MTVPNPPTEAVDDRDLDPVREMHRKSRRAFLVLGVSATAGLTGCRWLLQQPAADGLPYLVRRVLELNAALAEACFRETRLAPTFPRDMARQPRVNGLEGLPSAFDPLNWRLQVRGAGEPREVTLQDIKQLPRTEITTELKCIEGWSVIVSWAGARFSDFLSFNGPQRDGTSGAARNGQAARRRYVKLETPNGGYYVGMDMASALHPQTLLCYEMNGQPLPIAHGGPLRLVTTVKYGIKWIKRIGSITLTDDRPGDFWAERGYDWYAGL